MAGANTALRREAAAAGAEEPRHGAGRLFERQDRDASRSACRSSACTYNDDLNVNFIPVPTLTEAGYAGSYPAGLPGYAVVRPDRVAHLRPQLSGVLRRAEHVRQGLLRPDQPVDDRHAAPGQRRRQDSLHGTIRRNRRDRRDTQSKIVFSAVSACSAVSSYGVAVGFGFGWRVITPASTVAPVRVITWKNSSSPATSFSMKVWSWS